MVSATPNCQPNPNCPPPTGKKEKLKLTSQERRASSSLALLFAVRMLGLFLLTPVFADAAKTLIEGDNIALVGLAIGAYGLTQAIMQIPFGMISDKFGRRPVVIAGMALFIIGGIVCAMSDSVTGVIIGRAIQGFGAVSAAITAWVADATRPEVRTRAMAMVGGSIAISFAVSLVLSPLLVKLVGLSGLFWTISALGFICLLLATFMVPVVPMHDQAIPDVSVKEVMKNDSLLRLNFGVFCLHFILMALFVVLPSLIVQVGGYEIGQLWIVYLPVILVAFVLMVPGVFFVETRKMHRLGLDTSVAVLAVVMALFPLASYSLASIVVALIVFFWSFNMLEALQPSMVSRVSPPQHKGLAMGLYNMCQALGVAAGGALGGTIAHYGESSLVFLLGAAVAALWFFISRGMKALT